MISQENNKHVLFPITFLILILSSGLTEASVPLVVGIVLGKISSEPHQALIWVGVLALALTSVVVLNVLSHNVTTRWVLSRKKSMRREVGAKVSKHPVAVKVSVGASSVSAILGTDIAKVAAYPVVVVRWIAAIVVVIFISTYLFWLSIPLGALVLAGVPAFMWITQRAARPLENQQEALRERIGRIVTMSMDISLGLRTLWAVGGRSAFLARIKRENDLAQVEGLRLATSSAILLATVSFLPGVLLVAIVLLAGLLLNRNQLEPASLITFYAASAYLLIPIETTASVMQVRASAMAARKRLSSLMAAPVEHDECTQQVMFEVELPASGFHIESQRRKTDSGSYSSENDIVNSCKEHNQSLLIQRGNSSVFSGTVRALVDPLEKFSDREILDAVYSAAADDIICSLNGGLDEKVGEGGRRLSGGQRQRLLLARSLLCSSDVLVVEEPTSALDIATESTLADRFLQRRSSKISTLIASDSRILKKKVRGFSLSEGSLR